MIPRLSTRELIIESFRELAMNEPIKDITIQKIADNCGISKTSFYNNFADKEDLIIGVFDHFVLREVQTYAPEGDFRGFLQNRISVFRSVGDYCLNVSGGTMGIGSVFEVMVTHFNDALITFVSIRDEIDAADLSEDDVFEICFFGRGVMYTSMQWLRRKCDPPREEFVDRMINCMPPRARKLLL